MASVRCIVCRREGDPPGPPRCPTCGARAPWVPVDDRRSPPELAVHKRPMERPARIVPAPVAKPVDTLPVHAPYDDAAPVEVRAELLDAADAAELLAAADVAAKTKTTEPAPAPVAGDDDGELQIVDAADAADTVDDPVRVLTLPDVDRVLGGGLCRGRVLLLGGDRGSGKSRLVTQMLGVATGVFASAEETTDDGALRVKHLLTADQRVPGRVQLVQIPAASGVDAFVRLVRRLRPVIAVLDSLQAVAGENTRPQGAAMIALWQLARETTADGAPGTAIVVMSQMNGDGGLRGSKAIEQWCDVIAMVEPIEGRKGYRRLHCAAKNRYGSEEEDAIFRHTGAGLVPAAAELQQVQQAEADEKKRGAA